MKLLGTLTVFLAVAATSFAGDIPVVPEIDGSSAASVVALIAGGVMIARSRNRK